MQKLTVISHKASPMQWEIIISAVVGAVVSYAVAKINATSQQRKVKAESAHEEAATNEQIRATVMQLIEPLKERIIALEAELADWQDWAKRLSTQVKGLGCEPVPFKPGNKKGN